MRPMSAIDWIDTRGKRPLHEREQYGTGYYWRWVLPDGTPDNRPEELPREVFNRLKGGDPKFPWLYQDRHHATAAAMDAYDEAIRSGWSPN